MERERGRERDRGEKEGWREREMWRGGGTTANMQKGKMQSVSLWWFKTGWCSTEMLRSMCSPYARSSGLTSLLPLANHHPGGGGGGGRERETEIGRASGRERGKIAVVAVALKKKQKTVGEREMNTHA